MKNSIIACVILCLLFVSCKKDKDENPGSSSRTIQYEITGNYTGTLFASYTTAAGGTANNQLPSLPWVKEITYASNVTAAIIALSGNGGTPGQKITLSIKRGGTQVGTPKDIVADGSGGFSEALPAIVF
ncbi:hypothetical protein [Pedobacter psychroterrae]|uniref:MmpS family membrane protein n=1 Tax=Pedobacter psychroterrae TaxID=2530453 RepID=A0A4R0NKU9_9SPHI|nr:hypothetical protein [Pedobacter psychroterrae]TCD00518.1 hypothetical protein EZ437_14960 [Pedobacter psychroterrae]